MVDLVALLHVGFSVIIKSSLKHVPVPWLLQMHTAITSYIAMHRTIGQYYIHRLGLAIWHDIVKAACVSAVTDLWSSLLKLFTIQMCHGCMRLVVCRFT